MINSDAPSPRILCCNKPYKHSCYKLREKTTKAVNTTSKKVAQKTNLDIIDTNLSGNSMTVKKAKNHKRKRSWREEINEASFELSNSPRKFEMKCLSGVSILQNERSKILENIKKEAELLHTKIYNNLGLTIQGKIASSKK